MRLQNKPVQLVFTEGETEILKLLCNGCNIALYRTGQVRIRDEKHNPVKNIRMDMFEKIRKYTIQKDGLFYINPESKESFPNYIKI